MFKKYPRLTLLCASILFAYAVFEARDLLQLGPTLASLGYLGVFLTGMLFTYGFTSPPASALFIIIAKQTPALATGIIGAFGALLSDTLIFAFIRSGFTEEINHFLKEPFMQRARKHVPSDFRHVLFVLLGLAIIASPLPDEFGVIILASSGLTGLQFTFVSFIMNMVGIFALLAIGQTMT